MSEKENQGPQSAGSSPSASSHLRVSLMPWQNTSGTATSGVIMIGVLIALPLLIGILYMLFFSDEGGAKSPRSKDVPAQQAR